MFSHFLRKVLPFVWRGPRAAASAVRVGGRFWHLLPGAYEVLGEAGPDLDRWIAEGRTRVVKHATHRTVYRATLPGGTVFVKHCKVSNVRAWAREILRPAKARLEFENALALHERGIAAVEPLGWGYRHPIWPGESLLLTRGHAAAVPFLRFLEEDLPGLPRAEQTSARRHVAEALGQFLAKLHDAGIAHPDPHPGNLLIEWSPDRVQFALIDLHAVRFGPPLSRSESQGNLVLYNRWFQLRATRGDRWLFGRAYLQARAHLPREPRRMMAAWARELERQTLLSNLRFWAGRESRCLGHNRHFQRVKTPGLRGFAVRDLPAETLRYFLADPDAVFARPDARMLKDSRTSTVVELIFPSAAGPQAVVFKRFRVRQWWEPMKNWFRRSAAVRSWAMGHTFRDRWLPTPRPLAVFHRVCYGVPTVGFLLAEKVPDALDLPAAVARLRLLPPADRLRVVSLWVERIARLVRMLHAHGGSHRDLKASNFLMQGAATDLATVLPTFVDLVGARSGKPLPFAQRAKELARLNASFLDSPLVANTARLHFLRVYLSASWGVREDWKPWWRAIRRATAAKIAKNRRSGRPLG